MASILGKLKSKLTGEKYDSLNADLVEDYNSYRSVGPSPNLCFAPFTSLRFALSGNVIACCFNRNHIMGKYPENSVHDIWFGENAEELRRLIKNNDLSSGCFDCKRNITNQNYHAVGAKMYDYLGQPNNRYPTMLDFELGNTCNLECVMCNGENSSSIRKNREKMPAYPVHYDLGFVDQLAEFIPHLVEARFVGGEPFLNDIYYPLWNKIIKLNPAVKISVLTNATILNEKVKELLAKGNFHVSVSIDSLQKENYEAIRINGDFDRVMDNINYLYDYAQNQKKGFNLNVCPMRQNWEEMPDFVNYANEKDVPLVFHTVKFPLHTSLWNLPPEKLQEIIEYLSGFQFQSNSEIQVKNSDLYQGLLDQLKQWYSEAIDRNASSNGTTAELDIDALKKLFKKKIRAYVSSESGRNGQDVDQKTQEYIVKLEAILKSLNDEKLELKALQNIKDLPIDMLIAEMEISTVENIAERFKTVALV